MFPVMLNPSAPTKSFSRSVKDAAGQLVGRLTFTRDEPLLLTREQFEAVRSDMGHALIFVQTATGEKGELIPINKRANPQPELPPGPPARPKAQPSLKELAGENAQLRHNMASLQKEFEAARSGLAKSDRDLQEAVAEVAELQKQLIVLQELNAGLEKQLAAGDAAKSDGKGPPKK